MRFHHFAPLLPLAIVACSPVVVGHVLHLSEGAAYASDARAFEQTIEHEVVPHLASDRPNVLVLPDRVALSAAFVGARGTAARSKGSACLAYVALEGLTKGQLQS